MGPNTRATSHSASGRRNMSNIGPTRLPPLNDPSRFGTNNNPVVRLPPLTAQRNPPVDEARQLRSLYDKHMEDIGVAQGKDTE
jgi:hypothetical protein